MSELRLGWRQLASQKGRMSPEQDFEDDKIIRWQEAPGHADEIRDDPSVLSIDIKTEEVFESRGYGLGRGAARRLARSAARAGIPPPAVVEFSEGMSFKILAKRRRSDGLLTYLLIFTGLGERYLLLREDWVSEERYRDSVSEFEAAVLPTRLVQAPLVVTREEWHRYEQGMGEGTR